MERFATLRADCRYPHREGEGPARRRQWSHRNGRAVVDDLFDSGEINLERGSDRCVGRDTPAPLRRRRPVGRTGSDRKVGDRNDRSGFVLHEMWLLRLHALLAQVRGDDVRLSRLSGSLPRDGDIAWLRGAHGVGRGDDMTGSLRTLLSRLIPSFTFLAIYRYNPWCRSRPSRMAGRRLPSWLATVDMPRRVEPSVSREPAVAELAVRHWSATRGARSTTTRAAQQFAEPRRPTRGLPRRRRRFVVARHR